MVKRPQRKQYLQNLVAWCKLVEVRSHLLSTDRTRNPWGALPSWVKPTWFLEPYPFRRVGKTTLPFILRKNRKKNAAARQQVYFSKTYQGVRLAALMQPEECRPRGSLRRYRAPVKDINTSYLSLMGDQQIHFTSTSTYNGFHAQALPSATHGHCLGS